MHIRDKERTGICPSCLIFPVSLKAETQPASKSNKPVHKIKISYLPVSCLQKPFNHQLAEKRKCVSPAVKTPSFSSLLCHCLVVVLAIYVCLHLLSRQHFYGQFGWAHTFFMIKHTCFIIKRVGPINVKVCSVM